MSAVTSNLSMTAKLIEFFVLKTKGHITKFQLFKFLYLADLYATRWHGKQITDLHWIFYKYGPWEEDIDKTLRSLESLQKVVQTKSGEAILIRPGKNAMSIEQLELPISMQYMLENIRAAWSGTTQKQQQELRDYVYATAPMKDVLEKEYTPDQKQPLNLLKERELLLAELGNLVCK
ncbi:hypothetical protein Pse7367_1360 [Thalassoporum mexicanum PCC 7367]|uniref:Panacea domain-containing protein n=1 Tax=Thalassoporum mexicanum TaxID=3457544 RepID=UPI00029FE414|nr:Panacea domain-containing protein [Pseudanabaena sp. PCC 7367]AFY69652.1 hypothetical protein Pse7367_1360 [Pseudanabaena sp. PCC 7367]